MPRGSTADTTRTLGWEWDELGEAEWLKELLVGEAEWWKELLVGEAEERWGEELEEEEPPSDPRPSVMLRRRAESCQWPPPGGPWAA